METSEPPELNVDLNADASAFSWILPKVVERMHYGDDLLSFEVQYIQLRKMETSEPPKLNVNLNVDASAFLWIAPEVEHYDDDLWSFGVFIRYNMLVEKIDLRLITPLDFPRLDFVRIIVLPSFKSNAATVHCLDTFCHLLLQILRVFLHLLNLLHQILFSLVCIHFMKMLSLFYWLQEQFLKIWWSIDHTRCVINTCARFTRHDECWGFTSAGEWLRTHMNDLTSECSCVCSVLF